MAFVSLLLSFIGKKVGAIIQAIFGWSVTALFGRLPQKKQLAVTVGLVLSIAWPLFVAGLFFPAVAGWALAILPLASWFGPLAMRITWGALAVLAPPIVGLLVHWAAPTTRGSALRSAVAGYPLALGFFASFIVTAVTVPIVKLASIARGWADEHVYVQPRPGAYRRVVKELAEACARGGALPEVGAPPPRMTLATNVLRVLAKGAVSPIVAEEILTVRSEGLELVLYPSDLLIRGEPARVARVRAMMTRTELDAEAYLVASARGQQIQDELGRLIDVIRAHEASGFEVGAMATRRLAEVWREMNDAELPYDEWVLLESIARRVERRLVVEHTGASMPLEELEDGIEKVAAKANALPGAERARPQEEMTMNENELTPERLALEEASTADLVREALDEAKELVRIEIEIAKSEVEKEIAQAKKAAIGFGVALAASVLVLCLLAVALVLALGGTALAALAVAGGILVVGGAAGFAGYTLLPKRPLERTRHRLRSDVTQLKEHIA